MTRAPEATSCPPRPAAARRVALVVASVLALPLLVAPASTAAADIAPPGAAGQGTTSATTPTVASATAFPRTPPARICGNTKLLSGPTAPPKGAVRVKPGQNLNALTQARPEGTTFWLAPGVHTLGSSEFGQVIPKDDNVYIGAPGAVLDGKNVNRYAFTQHATGVKIRYLTIQNFGGRGGNHNEGVVNHDSGTGWVMERLTVRNNAGAGIFLGSNNVVRYNCLSKNRQYGLSGYKSAGIRSVTVDHNEISGNNTDEWEVRSQGCGCSGGAKFWDITGATVTNNWVHDNKGPGLWADTNNIGFRFEGNYISDNHGEGIFYEISYNALIRNNTLVRNALVKGKAFAARGDNFPVGAIYLSEAGGDGRANAGVYSSLEVTGNLLSDNWGGVILWENANRFCASDGNTSIGYCTVPGAGSLKTCVSGTIESEPYLSDCRWKTQNVRVHDNDFHMDAAKAGCTPTTPSCGMHAVISNFGTFPSWSPYKGTAVQEAITFSRNNRFANNRYVGPWRFNPYEPGRVLSLAEWQAAPYGQDAGSTTMATAPSGVEFGTVTPDGSRIHVRWRNPANVAWAKTVIRRGNGIRAPATPTSGAAVYSGTASAVTDRVTAGRTYRYAAFAYDTSGRMTRTISRPVTAVGRPRMAATTPTSTAASALPFRVRWSAVAATSYVVEYTEKSRESGPWALRPWTTWRDGTRASSAVFNPGVDGRALFFRASARDAYGNVTPASAAAQAVVPLDDTSPMIRYSAGWSTARTADRWLGAEHATKTAGSSATLVAEASGFTIIGTRCRSCGTFRVYVDDVLKATVDTRASTTAFRRPLVTVRLTGGIQTHRLVIRATGSGPRPWTRIDAVSILR